MAFTLGESFVMPDITKAFQKTLKQAMGKGSSILRAFTAVQKVYNKEVEKAGSKTKLAAKGLFAFSKGVSAAASMMLNSIGVFLQLANSMGILQPILQLISGVFSMIGGAAMEILAPAIAELAEVLFSEEMIQIWGLLGKTIGTFLKTILTIVADLFSNPEFQKVLKTFIEIIGNILMFFATVLGWFFDILSGMSADEMGRLFFGIGVFLAFMYGVAQGSGTIFGLVLGTLYAAVAAIALAPLLGLAEGGIVTQPTIALIGEAGPEVVIPLNQAEGMGVGTDQYTQKEILWATESNGKKLDKLVNYLGYKSDKMM